MAKSSKSKSRKPAIKATQREVVHAKLKHEFHVDGERHLPIGMLWAKKTLGWKEEGKGGSNVTYGSDYLVQYEDADENKIKVRCDNNVTNRPLTMGNVKALQQEILNGRWDMNGEPILIGKTGLILNGQHQLIALVLATLEYRKNPDTYTFWGDEPTIAKSVTYGINEGDKVVNTMDTCKPRTLADVIYRCPYFASLTPQQRKQASNITQHTIRLLWCRTGENMDGLSNYRSHAEFVDFLDRHLKVLECVNFITAENGKEAKLSNYLSPGYCAALLYLFGASKTKTEKYLCDETTTEKHIDWGNWSLACDFFVLLAANDSKFVAVRKTLAAMVTDETASIAVRMGVLIKAWNLYSAGKPITSKAVALEFVEDEDGFAVLTEFPKVGGVDIGDIDEMSEEDLAKLDRSSSSQEQKARQTEILDKKKANGKTKPPATKAKPKLKKSKAKSGVEVLVGKPMWVKPTTGDIYRCRVNDIVGEVAHITILQGHAGAGNKMKIKANTLLKDQPT